MVSTGQLLWQLNKAIAPSHPSGLPTVLSDVRYWMNSRRHLLAASISGFDPSETSSLIEPGINLKTAKALGIDIPVAARRATARSLGTHGRNLMRGQHSPAG
jgi:hypothetical protein